MSDPNDIATFETGLLRHASRRLAGNGIIDSGWFDSLVMRTVEGARDWRDLSADTKENRYAIARS